MVSKTIISALGLLAATTSALPSRTHCRCTIVNASSQNPEQITPPTHSPYRTSPPHTFGAPRSQHEICLTLGPELENFRHSNPKAYSEFMSRSTSSDVWVDASSPAASRTDSSATTPTSQETPLSTSVLLRMGSGQGLQGLGVVLPSAPTHRPRPHSRIVCKPEEPQSYKAYQDNIYTLIALQIIVAFAVLACVVEGITVLVRWFRPDPNAIDDYNPPPSRPAALRLTGDEKLLRAFPSLEPIFSPGAYKKSQSYSSQTWTPSPVDAEKKVFEAWVVDEDDEINRPVM